ncbi:MAG: ATP-dependent Clp protease proteolytic subunit [Coriobacteriaceae bacterium]|nr:ATP-dependent Clp protease proteolytic subunit [Coriobacteriaceae bacterium]
MPIINPASITNLENGRCDHLDVLSELFNSRVLMLSDQITSAVCSQLIADMLVLEQKDPHAPITLLVSSPGGDVYAGLGLIDVMRDLTCPVDTVGYGLVASMAAVVLACGRRRRVYPNTNILLHQLMTGTGMSQQSDIDIVAVHASALRSRLDDLLSEHMNITAEEVHALTERDCWCDARRALELGVVDEVIRR